MNSFDNSREDINYFSDEIYHKIINFLRSIRYDFHINSSMDTYDNDMLFYILKNIEDIKNNFCYDEFKIFLDDLEKKYNINTDKKLATLHILQSCECYFYVHKNQKEPDFKENNSIDYTVGTAITKIDKLMKDINYSTAG